MSDAKPAEGAEGGKKKNPKIMIIIVAAAVLLLGGGAAAFFLLKPKPEAVEAGKDKKEEKPKEAKDKKPFIVDFESFTVNLKDPEKFLQIKLTFQMKNAEGAEAMKDLMPIVRAAVIPVLGGQDAAEIGTPEGKTKLCEQVAEAAKKSLEGKEAAESIDAVLITHMIIQ